MSYTIKEEDILFLDIETVSQYPDFDELSDNMKALWERKSKYIKKEDQTSAEIYGKAAIYAEFGKIVCISAGFVSKGILRVKSFFGNDEKIILSEFKELLQKSFSIHDKYLCAHNGKEFDFPYIARRMLVNSINLPVALDIAGKKPWEIKHLDTLELWRFGDYKNYTSLSLLTEIFGIPTPKDDIDGSMVGEVYWKEKNTERIAKYCEKDVVAIVQLYRKYKCKELIGENNIISLTNFDT